MPAEGDGIVSLPLADRTVVQKLKSHNRLKAFATKQKAIAEGLIWSWLLALLVKRSAGADADWRRGLSMLKIAKNSALWLMPILASIIHGAWQEITEEVGVGNGVFIQKQQKSRQKIQTKTTR